MKIMKKKLIILSLIITGSLIYQSYSYSSAQLGQEASYNVVSEEQALISINYDEMRQSFTLTNNTGKTIEVTDIHIDGNDIIANEGMSDLLLIAGKSKEYFIEGDANHLTGEIMTIFITSEKMKMEISSTIPQFIEKAEEVEDGNKEHEEEASGHD